MKFKLFIETINHDKAKSFVLDVVGSPEDPDKVNDVLAAPLRYHPNLADNLTKYAELQPYASQVKGWVYANPQKTLQQLVDFIASIDDPQRQTPRPSMSDDNYDSTTYDV